MKLEQLSWKNIKKENNQLQQFLSDMHKEHKERIDQIIKNKQQIERRIK